MSHLIEYFCKDNNITKEYLLQHPNFKDEDGFTCAIKLASYGYIPPEEL